MLAIADVNAIHPIGSLFAYVNADSHFFRLAFTSASKVIAVISTFTGGKRCIPMVEAVRLSS